MNGHNRFQRQQFRMKLAYGPFPKGHVFEPTGIYRDRLLAMGVIEPVAVVAEVPPAEKRPLLGRRRSS